MHSLVEYTIGWLGSSLIAEYRPTDRTNERTDKKYLSFRNASDISRGGFDFDQTTHVRGSGRKRRKQVEICHSGATMKRMFG